MKWYAPDIYPAFRCIGGRCRHSCCIGWQIGIDAEALARYKGEKGPFGQRLAQGILETAEGAVFRMDEQGRCCFLNQDGLCELMLHLGPDSLCQVCDDHPRFRNHLASRTELGLGLCCEEAARLLVTHRAPMRLILLRDDGRDDPAPAEERAFLSQRAYLFALLGRRSVPLDTRLKRLLTLNGAQAVPIGEWTRRLQGLERLDPAFDQTLALLALAPEAPPLTGPVWDTAFEQLAFYFVYRHFTGALKDGRRAGRAAFAAGSVQVLRALCRGWQARYGGADLAALAELARQYSAEVEYSQPNLQIMLGQ